MRGERGGIEEEAEAAASGLLLVSVESIARVVVNASEVVLVLACDCSRFSSK